MTEQFGGGNHSGIGFAMGMERFMLVLEQAGITLEEERGCDLFIIPLGDRACKYAVGLTDRLLNEGGKVQYDLLRRSVKAQMKYADKIGARYTLILGDNELAAGEAQLKNMETGEQTTVSIDTFTI